MSPRLTTFDVVMEALEGTVITTSETPPKHVPPETKVIVILDEGWDSHLDALKEQLGGLGWVIDMFDGKDVMKRGRHERH